MTPLIRHNRGREAEPEEQNMGGCWSHNLLLVLLFAGNLDLGAGGRLLESLGAHTQMRAHSSCTHTHRLTDTLTHVCARSSTGTSARNVRSTHTNAFTAHAQCRHTTNTRTSTRAQPSRTPRHAHTHVHAAQAHSPPRTPKIPARRQLQHEAWQPWG